MQQEFYQDLSCGRLLCSHHGTGKWERRHSPCPWDPDSTHSQSGKRIRAFLCPLGEDTWVGVGEGEIRDQSALTTRWKGQLSC